MSGDPYDCSNVKLRDRNLIVYKRAIFVDKISGPNHHQLINYGSSSTLQSFFNLLMTKRNKPSFEGTSKNLNDHLKAAEMKTQMATSLQQPRDLTVEIKQFNMEIQRTSSLPQPYAQLDHCI